MRIYSRADFLELPPGTLYCKGGPDWGFADMSVKYDTLRHPPHSADFVTLGLQDIDAHDSGQLVDRMMEMQETGAGYPLSDAAGRDGCFDDDALFLVYEHDDLVMLRRIIDEALAVPGERKKR